MLRQARGRVLEIGAGTGLNASLYPSTAEELILTEPVPAMLRRLGRRTTRDPRVRTMSVLGSELQVEDSSVDTVVSTLVLCTVPSVEPVLAEIARVLKPGGRLLFCEHVRATDARLARRQDRFAGLWAAFAQGCRCNRDTLSLLLDRFTLEKVDHARWSGMPSLVRPLVMGSAVPIR
ncbi:class I SAM-dependent methyltransferase [Lentzea sp. NBRC 105346]|uniref:class I SAM-dependent methyltransferase n=1 Tax=Lentzea sp. NBRC 105346 TaxID=3032205 RepID=UPI0025560F9E|nr:class I SAM-dependent methyltransferase [Lentzea sp. NBRC 105346]